MVSLQLYQMALCFVLVNECTCVFTCTRAHTHTLSFVRMRSLLFLFSVHCVDTIPAFMRLPEPICVPTGAILAQMRPPLGTIWALLKAVSTPPPLSSAHCDQSYLLWRKEELWILSVSLWNSWCFRSSSKARGWHCSSAQNTDNEICWLQESLRDHFYKMYRLHVNNKFFYKLTKTSKSPVTSW